MELSKLKSLVKQGESSILEFKSKLPSLKGAFETLCAFLNGEGGTVLVGVKDDGQISGQHVTDNTQQEIAKHINKLEPAVEPIVDYIPVDGEKKVIAVRVNSGETPPYSYDGRAFRRSQSTTRKMSRDFYHRLLKKHDKSYSWEEIPAADYTIDDLDHEEIQLAVRQGIDANRLPASSAECSIRDILSRWHLLVGNILNNAAIVLFAKNIGPHYVQCHLQLARFRGTDKLHGFIDSQEHYCNAFRLLSEADIFMRRHLPIASFFKSDEWQRIDKPALPVLAVREALVNAVCHRDYSNRSTSVMLAIFDDRLELWNLGTLPEEIKITDLKKEHPSVPHNKLIAKVFYDRNFFEGWGTGTNRIFELCREANVPPPIFQEHGGGLLVTFRFKEPIGATAVKSNLRTKPETTLRQKEIIAILTEQGRVSPQNLLSLITENISDRTLRRDLAELQLRGLIDSEGHGRRTRWFLKK